MSETYRVKIIRSAEAQLREIDNYIRYTLQAPGTAARILDILASEILSLEQFPYRVLLTEEEPWRSRGIRKLPVKNFLVYFWVDEEAKEVQIAGVIYGRRDQRHQLSNLDRF